MSHVYLIRSMADPKRTYVGCTENLGKRIAEHNQGESQYTAKYIPWDLEVAVMFKNTEKARQFEKYLKSGSGHAFAKRHFW